MSFRVITAAAVLAVLAPSVAGAAPATPAATQPVAATPVVAATPAASDPAGAHAAIAQAQERLAEMDATVTVLQEESDKVDAAARQKARDAVTALKTVRDTYKKEIDGVVAQGRQMTAEQLKMARTALTAPYTQFEQALDGDVALLKLDVAQRKAIVEARLKAEQAYWQGVAADLQATAANLTVEQRAAIDARIVAVRARVEAAQLRLTKLGHVGRTAWSALKQGFINSRQVVDDYRAGR